MHELIIKSASYIRLSLEIYSWLHIAAFILSWIHADPFNPIVVFVNRCTIPLWNWVEERLPYRLSPFSPIFALMLIYYCEVAVPGLFYAVGTGLMGLIEFDSTLLYGFLYLLIAFISVSSWIAGFILILAILWFVMSLVNAPLNNPFTRTIMNLVDPLISPLQRILPRAKIDLSSIALAVLAFLLQNNLIKVQVYLVSSFQLPIF